MDYSIRFDIKSATLSLPPDGLDTDPYCLVMCVWIQCSVRRPELQEAFKAGCSKLHFEFASLCQMPKDDKLPFEKWKNLEKDGLDFGWLFHNKHQFEYAKKQASKGEDIDLTPEAYVAIYLYLAERGDHRVRAHVLKEVEPEPVTLHAPGFFRAAQEPSAK